ncbi:MAG: Maf family protein [Hominimerdicola sp.]
MSLLTRDFLNEYDVILASASPRRKELLQLVCNNFRVIPSDCEEIIPPDLNPEDTAEYLSSLKCRSIAEVYRQSLVIGCDTAVICNGEIFGKPKDEDDAIRMLTKLSGKEHLVISGVTLGHRHRCRSFSNVTRVTFRTLSEKEINEYVASGEPMDKAGAYGIQGLGSLLIERIEGDFYSVMGLPVSQLAEEIEKFLAPIQSK